MEEKIGKNKVNGLQLFITINTIFFISLLCSCKSDKKLNINKIAGELQFTVEYSPYQVDGSSSEDNRIEYFRLELNHVNGLDLVQYLSESSTLEKEDVLHYLSYKLNEDIYLIEGGRKKENVLYHFERSFDLKRGRIFNIGFEPDTVNNQEKTLLIDSDLLNVGQVKLNFRS